jgi:predicted nucleic acid-binding protein
MKRLIVTDTGPLIIFARTGTLPVLRGVADQIVLTQTVQLECTRNAWQPGAAAILEALAQGHLTLVPDVATDATGKATLDPGEKSAINYALTQDPQHCRLLMDEVRGRVVAKHLGLAVIGSAGLLVVAKQMGLVAQVKPVIESWRQSGYWIDKAVVDSVLQAAFEVS